MQSIKYHLLFVVLILFGLNAFPQNKQKILILGEDGPLSSAHLLCGDEVIAVSDSSGHFFYDKTYTQNTLTITHVQYEEITIDTPTADTLIYLQKSQNIIQESVFFEENQWSILKTNLNKNLLLYHSMKGHTLVSQDTLIRDGKEVQLDANGTITFVLPTKKPLVKIKTVKDGKGADIEFSDKKQRQTWTRWIEKSIRETFSNALYYAYLLFLPEPKEGLFVTYNGHYNEYEVFSFYLPPDAENGNARIKGRVYIQSNSGILARIEAKLIPLRPNVSTLYEINIQYAYDSHSNTVMPSKLSGEAYYLDEDLNVVMTRKSERIIDLMR